MFKKRADKGMAGELPKWLREELAQAPPPDRSVLERYAHLRGDLVETFRAVAQERCSEESTVRRVMAAFSRAGAFLSADPEQGASGRQLAFAVRSLERGGGRETIARVTVAREQFRILIETVREAGKVLLEINAVDSDDIEVRPLRARLLDESGAEIGAARQVEYGDSAASFPLPESGLCRILVSWKEHEEELRLEFKDTARPEQ